MSHPKQERDSNWEHLWILWHNKQCCHSDKIQLRCFQGRCSLWTIEPPEMEIHVMLKAVKRCVCNLACSGVQVARVSCYPCTPDVSWPSAYVSRYCVHQVQVVDEYRNSVRKSRRHAVPPGHYEDRRCKTMEKLRCTRHVPTRICELNYKCVYACLCLYVFAVCETCMHTDMWTRGYACMPVCIDACVHACAHTCLYVLVGKCSCVTRWMIMYETYACVCAYIHACNYLSLYIYIYTHVAIRLLFANCLQTKHSVLC